MREAKKYSDFPNDNNFIFFNFKFFYSKYFHFILPLIYFLVMLFVSFTNRKIGDYGVETDFYVAYIPQAKELLNGNLILDPFRGPIYQIFLTFSGIIFNYEFYSAGKFLDVVSAGITLFFVSKLISSILNREAAFIVVLLIAVNQVFWRYTYEPGTDMLFLTFYISSLYFILKEKELSNKNLFIAGILTSLAYLTRYTGISLIVLVILIFIIKFYKKFKLTHSIKKIFNVKAFVCFAVPVIILISTWGIISNQKTGSFFYNMNYQNTAYTIYKPDDMPKDEWTYKYQDEFKSMSDVVFKDIGAFIKKIFFQNFTTYFIKDLYRLLPTYFGILAPIGLLIFIVKWKSQNASVKYFFIAAFLFYLQILLIFYSERFTLPLLPFYCFIIVKLFSQNIIDRFNLRSGKVRFFGMLLSLLIIFTLYNSFTVSKKEINNGPEEILIIRDYIEKNYTGELSGKNIMARKPHIAYYLNMHFTVMPYVENYKDLLSKTKESNIDFIFVSEKEGSVSTNEDLKKNLLNIGSPPELELITYTTNPTAVLYKVKK